MPDWVVRYLLWSAIVGLTIFLTRLWRSPNCKHDPALLEYVIAFGFLAIAAAALLPETLNDLHKILATG